MNQRPFEENTDRRGTTAHIDDRDTQVEFVLDHAGHARRIRIDGKISQSQMTALDTVHHILQRRRRRGYRMHPHT